MNAKTFDMQALLDAADFHKEEAADCLEAAKSASGDRGWWTERANRHARFADAIQLIARCKECNANAREEQP